MESDICKHCGHLLTGEVPSGVLTSDSDGSTGCSSRADRGPHEYRHDDAWYIAEAGELHGSEGEVEIASPRDAVMPTRTSIVSRGGDGGAYVMAWVWVPEPDEDDEEDETHKDADLL